MQAGDRQQRWEELMSKVVTIFAKGSEWPQSLGEQWEPAAISQEGFYWRVSMKPSSASAKWETFSYKQTENMALNPKLFFSKPPLALDLLRSHLLR